MSHIQKKFNSLSQKKSSTLVEKRFIKEGQFNESFKKSSILWAFFPKVQSFESLLKKKKTKGFNSLSQFSRQDQSFLWVKIFVKQILWVMLKKWVQFCESCQKKGFNSVSHVKKKGSILWVIFKKNQFLESFLLFFLFKTFFESFFFFLKKKRFNSVSHNFWKVQNSFNHIEKKFNSVGHIQEKGSIHWDLLKKKVQFFESSWKRKETILYFRIKRSSTLWVFSFDTRFNSLSHSSRKVQFFESFLTKFVLNSLSHILEIRFNFFILKRRVLFCEWKEGFNSVSLFRFKKKFDSLSHTQKEIQFFESYSQMTFNSMSHKKGINSMSHNSFEKKKV